MRICLPPVPQGREAVPDASANVRRQAFSERFRQCEHERLPSGVPRPQTPRCSGTILIEPAPTGTNNRQQAPTGRCMDMSGSCASVAESAAACCLWQTSPRRWRPTPREPKMCFFEEPSQSLRFRTPSPRFSCAETTTRMCTTPCSSTDDRCTSRRSIYGTPQIQTFSASSAGTQAYIRPLGQSSRSVSPWQSALAPASSAVSSTETTHGIGIYATQSQQASHVRVTGGVDSILGPSAPAPTVSSPSHIPAFSQSSCGSTNSAPGNGQSTWCQTSPVTVGGQANASAQVKIAQAPAAASSQPNYSRAKTTQAVVEQKMVPEGYDRVEHMVPRLRPVSVVENRIEIPVVKVVDTIVHKQKIEERIRFVDKPVVQEVEKFVEVPEVIYSDVIVEVPEIVEVIKHVPKEEIRENITYVPRFETKIIPKYVDVPIIKIVDRYEEVHEIHEVLKPVAKVKVVDVPKEFTRIVPKYSVHKTKSKVSVPDIQYKEVPRYRMRYEPKILRDTVINHIPQYLDIEVPYEVPKVTVVDQPFFVTTYRDHQYPVPVSHSVTPVLLPGDHTQVVDVPVEKPYVVVHDKFTPRPPIPELIPGQAVLRGITHLDKERLTAEQQEQLARQTTPSRPASPDHRFWEREREAELRAPLSPVHIRPPRQRKFFAGMPRQSCGPMPSSVDAQCCQSPWTQHVQQTNTLSYPN
ncbi:alveolin domain containing intermediate filament IMC15 [Toxoplasma gondii p89]|uniref:Alveolin domain containing intermediate filament IMC15 n=1 Tax=Toxoplasma gondii p89 TaxID=943119 RepID=A0A086KSS7_TOXGO|nr:alveolin domain containing intermediate filament IMC15 [Toxoplasma gondii p89]